MQQNDPELHSKRGRDPELHSKRETKDPELHPELHLRKGEKGSSDAYKKRERDRGREAVVWRSRMVGMSAITDGGVVVITHGGVAITHGGGVSNHGWWCGGDHAWWWCR